VIIPPEVISAAKMAQEKGRAIDAPAHVLSSVERLFSLLCENELDSDQMDDAFGDICTIRDWITFGQ